jgi:hypothetical protein
MNTAIALPLVTGLSYRSAYTPPITEIGLLAVTPVRNLNTKSPPHVGAKAHAIVKTVKAKNVEIMIICRPYASDSGPNSKGPTTYPTRYIDMGSISAVCKVM